MFDTLPLSPWQRFLLWPGGTFMDWLARRWPGIVIEYDFGFTVQSYVFWSGVISLAFWLVVLLMLAGLVQWGWRRIRM